MDRYSEEDLFGQNFIFTKLLIKQNFKMHIYFVVS